MEGAGYIWLRGFNPAFRVRPVFQVGKNWGQGATPKKGEDVQVPNGSACSICKWSGGILQGRPGKPGRPGRGGRPVPGIHACWLQLHHRSSQSKIQVNELCSGLIWSCQEAEWVPKELPNIEAEEKRAVWLWTVEDQPKERFPESSGSIIYA